MLDEISDNRLHALLKRHMRTKDKKTRETLKGLMYCGSQVIHVNGATPAVFVVSNNESSRFFGLRNCRSPWSCPKCSAVVMAKKGTDIACAIDALLQWENQIAFMITFTLPHTKNMTCAETFTILEKTWHMFKRAGNRRGKKQTYELRTNKENDKRGVGKKGDTVTYNKGNDPFGNFRETLGIKHFVRVYEFTWGENSWHPHIHSIFWVPRDNFDKVLDYEEQLNERWWQCAKHCALKFWNQKNPEHDNKARVESLYADWKKGHKSVTFSRDKLGNLRQQKSSNYVSGWSGDFEVAGGHIKKANNGHFSPRQILEQAFEEQDDTKRAQWLDLYVEYALATRGHRRVNFSARSGIINIIRKWKETQAYIELCKKKSTVEATAQWKVVCWFNERQWWSICLVEDTDDINIKAKILQLARLPDAKQQITSLLLSFGIDIRDNREHNLTEVVEEIYNVA